MTKFILIIWVCSFLGTSPACLPPMEFPKQFDTWYECTRGAHSEALIFDSYRDCSLYGYQHTVNILTKMPEEKIEKWHIHTRFSCKAEKSI